LIRLPYKYYHAQHVGSVIGNNKSTNHQWMNKTMKPVRRHLSLPTMYKPTSQLLFHGLVMIKSKIYIVMDFIIVFILLW